MWRTRFKRLLMTAYCYGLLSKAVVQIGFRIFDLKHV
jgi:hypothetical protein